MRVSEGGIRPTAPRCGRVDAVVSPSEIWERVKPWLERAEHSEFLFGWLVWPVIGGVIGGAWAWWNSAPGYVRYLAGLAAFVLSLGAVNFVLLLKDRRERRAALDALPAGAARRAGAQFQAESIKPRHVIGSCILISVITSIFWYTIQTFNYDMMITKNTYLYVIPRVLRVRSPAYPKVGIDISYGNAGYIYPIVGLLYQHRFEYPAKQLSKGDEDIVMREVIAGLDRPNINGSEMYARDSKWVTLEDDRLGDNQWQEFVDGKRLIYLFVAYTYYVHGTIKITEFCMWLYKGFPAHECHDHNKTIEE